MAFGQQKNPLNNQGIHSAADGNRTRDLRTTNATLYRLSHSSNYMKFAGSDEMKSC